MSNTKKLAIVTGATGSIGYSIIEELVQNNYKVIGLARNINKLKSLKEISHENIEVYSLDLKKNLDIVRFFQTLKQQNISVDLLVNCAGGGPLGGVQDVRDVQWEDNIQLKVLGYIRTSKEVIPIMNAENGRIINIIGTFGKQPSPFFAIGSVTNAALLSFTKELALELSNTGITVNAINPGAVKSVLWTETINQILSSENQGAKFLASSNIKLTMPEDIARAVLYLADEKNQCITGTSVNVDNGAYAGF